MSETNSSEESDLVLHEMKKVKGRVVGPEGHGLPGASVSLLPLPSMAGLIANPTTNWEGAFEADIRDGSAALEVVVQVPGYSLLQEIRSVEDDWTLSLSKAGGQILIVLPETRREAEGDEKVAPLSLQRIGQRPKSLGFYQAWAARNGSHESTGLLPLLPPGEYLLCSGGSCVGGTLSAFQTLQLEIPEDVPPGSPLGYPKIQAVQTSFLEGGSVVSPSSYSAAIALRSLGVR